MTRPATRTYDQLTIRVGPEVGRRLRVLAKAQGVSVSRVVDETLRTGVGLGSDDGKPHTVGTALDWLVGTLSDEDARGILDAVSVHDRIAAHAMEHGATVLSADAHFEKVAGLVVARFRA